MYGSQSVLLRQTCGLYPTAPVAIHVPLDRRIAALMTSNGLATYPTSLVQFFIWYFSSYRLWQTSFVVIIVAA